MVDLERLKKLKELAESDRAKRDGRRAGHGGRKITVKVGRRRSSSRRSRR